MSDNLADDMFLPESGEHDQELICAFEHNGEWVQIVPGTLDLMIAEERNDIEFIADSPWGTTIQGYLSEVTGIRSIDPPEGYDDGYTKED